MDKKAVSEYLLKLPRCNQNVVIVSPKYGDSDYACEVVVAAKDLLPWTEHHSEAVFSFDEEIQVARKALPIWLRNASSEENKTSSYVDYFMYKVLRLYVFNFIKDEIAKIYCLKYQSFISGVQMEDLDREKTRNWSQSTSIWECSKGHQLYYKKNRIHVCR